MDYKYLGAALMFMSLAFSGSAWFCARLNEVSIIKWERLPRNKLAGTVLAGVALLWCASEAEPLVSKSYHSLLVPLAILSAWASYMFLDFLFSRAIGGTLILTAHFILHESFAAELPWHRLLAVFCFISGAAGIVLCGKPYWLREFMRRCSRKHRFKLISMALLSVFSIVFLVYAFISLATVR